MYTLAPYFWKATGLTAADTQLDLLIEPLAAQAEVDRLTALGLKLVAIYMSLFVRLGRQEKRETLVDFHLCSFDLRFA